MNWISLGVETAATIVESWIALSAVTKMSGQKYTGKRHFLSVGCGILVMTFLIGVCNFVETLSFVTVGLALVATALLARFTSTGSILLRITGSVLAFLTIHTVDYILIFAMAALSKNDYTFIQFLTPGFLRHCYLVIDKIIDVILLLALGRRMPKLGSLRNIYLTALLTISSAAYITTHFLLTMILVDSSYVMQIALILSWIFMVCCVALAFAVFLISTNYQNEQESNRLLSLSNTFLEENYEHLHEHQDKMEKLTHDFKHHIGIIRDLAKAGKTEKIMQYTDPLLDSFQTERALCRSGNDVIDSIINFKAAEAHDKQICFQYKVEAPALDSMEPVDICAILANQLDNAFEACQLIPEVSERIVTVHIWHQTERIVLFQVRNRVICDPFADNPELRSTKQDHSRPHGFGIKSIQETTAKYQGLLENTFQDGYFVSTVLLNCRPLENETRCPSLDNAQFI